MKIRAAIAASAAGQYAATAIQFVSALFIARLLTPDEIGVFSLGMSAVAISHALRDFGVSNYLVQKDSIDEKVTSAAFAFSLATGCLLAAVLLAVSGPLAEFYDDPRVGTVLSLLAVNMALLPFGSIAMARLVRSMAFARIAAIGAAAAFATAAVAVGLALAGWGYRALPIATIAGTVATILGSRLATDRMAFVWPELRDFRALLSFSAYLSGVSILRELAFNSRDLIIGKAIDMAAVGLFSRATGFLSTFNQVVISPVLSTLLPYLSDEKRAGRSPVASMLKSMQYTSCVAGLFYAHLSYSSDALLRLLFGEQWTPAGDSASILCLSGFLGSFCIGFGPLFVAHEKLKAVLFVEGFAKAFLVAAMAIGASYSMEGVAVAIALHYALLGALWTVTLVRAFPVTAGEVARAFLPSVIPTLSAAVAAASWFYSAGKPGSAFELSFIGGNLSILAAFVLTLWAARHPILNEIATLLSVIPDKARRARPRRRAD